MKGEEGRRGLEKGGEGGEGGGEEGKERGEGRGEGEWRKEEKWEEEERGGGSYIKSDMQFPSRHKVNGFQIFPELLSSM